MNHYEVDAYRFVNLVKDGMRCVDVRSPGEFERGHIPGATNVPLFSNEERASVGRCYKNAGRDAAMALGMSKVADHGIDNLAQDAKGEVNKVCLHCWRGGLRSGAMAWLLRRRGVEVYCLRGGYRSFRRWARGIWSIQGEFIQDSTEEMEREEDFSLEECIDTVQPRSAPQEKKVHIKKTCSSPQLIILSGRTGVGKTRVLQQLANLGEQILDLEFLASHRGSAFGYVSKQPTNEMFENLLAMAWFSLDHSRRIWVEDEEGHVGKCYIPSPLYSQMQSSKYIIRLTASMHTRVSLLLSDYLLAPDEQFIQYLINTTNRLYKRLGGERHKHAIELVKQRDFPAFTELLLNHYYDKLYDKHLAKRHLTPIDIPVVLFSDATDTHEDVYDTITTAKNAIFAHSSEFHD
uniref:Rhodanese domain-containing protein n=1 Tax=Aureoumbra lagunensis TaxID=44058 RepID=A0A6S8AB10_9STRA|mmetsp:Transcript_8180/g.11391  ORF Transcript_8180/g.11391 Transcript_8180/m.11391 type:complete len:405 (-) Transcript_8180:105-1319(-)